MTQAELLPRIKQLADLLGQAQTWAEVETAIAAKPNHKTAAWQMLSVPEKTRLKKLKRRAIDTQETDELGQIEQITKTAPGGDDLKEVTYTVVPPVVPVQTSIEDGFLILTEFSADIDCYEMLHDLTHHWTAEYKREVWKLLPLDLRQKYQDLKRTALAPATNAPQLVKKPAGAIAPPKAPVEILKGQRVKVHCQGSQRDGTIGVVKSVDGDMVIVWLEDSTIRQDLRRLECSMEWLEVLRE